jgi:histidine decarboxylase
VESDTEPDTDPAIRTVLDNLAAHLEAVRLTNIGWPAASDTDFTVLSRFFERDLLNNLGDPFANGAYPQHTKALEKEVVNFVADLMRAPADDRWGYVTAGAGEGNLYALHMARSLHPKGIVYYSEAAHYSVDKAVDLLCMPSIRVRADDAGRMDFHDLTALVGRNRDRPVVIVANIGTTMTEAIDDVRRISHVLDSLAIRRRFVHADAALSGIPLALLDPQDRPGLDFADGADSMIVSGHKFLGTPIPCGVVVVKASHRIHLTRTGPFIGSPDTTIGCSRSGHAALLIWYALRRYGVEGLRVRAEQAAGRDGLGDVAQPVRLHRRPRHATRVGDQALDAGQHQRAQPHHLHARCEQGADRRVPGRSAGGREAGHPGQGSRTANSGAAPGRPGECGLRSSTPTSARSTR